MKTYDNNTFNKIIKKYTTTSTYYKIQKNDLLIKQYLALICCITIVYILLKKAKLFKLSTTIEALAIINKDFGSYNKIDLIYQSLIIRLQSNNNFNINGINIDWTNMLKSIFVFFLGFYFSNIFEKQPLTGDNVAVLSFFTFFVLLSSTLLFDIIKLIFNKTTLKYKCFFEEIEEYKFMSHSKITNNPFIKILDFFIKKSKN